MAKKILKIGGIVLAVLLILAFILPFAFKGKIMEIAKKEINDAVLAKVNFEDVSISFFRSFPRVAVGLEKLEILGIEDFANDTLLSAKRIDVAVNLFSLMGSEMTINSITIDEPRIHALVNKNGKANWEIMKPAEEEPEEEIGASFNAQLKKYTIKRGYVRYVDVPGDMSAIVENLNHSGSGDFTSDLFTLSTSTKADAVSFTYTKIPYLVNAAVDLDADIEVNLPEDKYSFKTDDVQLNDMRLSTAGYFQFVNDTTYGMDISFNAPSTEFKTLLSLVPAIYANDFSKIKTSGTALFNGFVRGEYNSVKMPAFNVNLEVDNGFFQYPDLPQPVKNIGIAMKIDNPDGVIDHTVIDISKGHIEFGNDPFDFTLLVKNPETVQFIDAKLKGKLNLAQVTEFVKLSGNTKLTGMVDADAAAKGNMAVITQQKPGPFTANGFINIQNLNYSSDDFPQPIKNSNIKINLENKDGIADNTVIHIPAAHIEIGSDPIDFNVLIKNPATSMQFDGAAKGRFTLANVAQFTTLEPGTDLSGLIEGDMQFKGNKTAIDKEEYEKIHFGGTVSFKDINYKDNDLPTGFNVSNALLTLNPKTFTLNTLKAKYLNTNYTASGSLTNAIGYALKDEPIAGSLQLHADKINLNDLMGVMPAEDSAAAAEVAPSAPFPVPANIAFQLNAQVDELKYDNTTYQNLKGGIGIKDETVTLNNVQMDGLGGKLGVSGTYSTLKNKKQPDIAFAYDIKDVSIEKVFYAFNTVKQLMPIGQFISGNLNSALSINGKLGENMMPMLSSLTGNGTFAILEGVLKKFAPVEKIAQTLQIADLNGFNFKDVKSSFEFANGKVLVKPFKVKVKDIAMEVGGMHGLDQSLSYGIGMQVPRSILGNQGNALINNLTQQANAKGLNVSVSDMINLNLKLGGSITQPTVQTDLKDAAGDLAADLKQQATAFAQEKADSAKALLTNAKNELKDSATSIVNQAAQDLKEDLKNKLLGGGTANANDTTPKEDAKQKVENAAKSTLKNLLRKKE